jgi:dihydrofolate synthase/folylpolyglutamate synthase
LREGLVKVSLPGRFQVIPGDVTWILDVAHNGQAADTLAANLATFPCRGTLYAVFGVLKDKEPAAIVAPLAERVGQWHLGQTSGHRSLPVTELMHALDGVLPRDRMHAYGDLNQAMDGALAAARKGDCILVLGSFTTVEAALRQLTDQLGR